MRVLSTEEIRSRQMLCLRTKVPMATARWHEGCEAVGYWAESDSFVFKSHGHYLCLSGAFIRMIAEGELTFDEDPA